MSAPAIAVLDASVGVKWFRRDEAGHAEAVDLLRRHASGEIRLVVPVIFVHEVLDVARRTRGLDAARRLWERLLDDEIAVARFDGALAYLALDQCAALDCSVYDAMAPALAGALGATLYSADRRAHGRVPGAVIIGS